MTTTTKKINKYLERYYNPNWFVNI